MKKMSLFGIFITLIFLLQPVLGVDYQVDFKLDTYSVKSCPFTTTVITGVVKNTGNNADTYTLTPSSDWVTIAPNKISLSSQESKTVYFYLTPSYSVEGKYPIKIDLKSEHVSTSQNIDLTLLSCHGVKLSPKTLINSECLGGTTKFEINIANLGNSGETFDLTTTKGTLSLSQISLDLNETKTIELSVPVTEDKSDVVINAKSSTSYARDSVTLGIVGEKCYNVDLNIQPSEKVTCIGEVSTYSISLKNIGTKQVIYNLSSDFGILSLEQVSLAQNEVKDVTLNVSSNQDGVYKINIKAKSDQIEIVKTVNLTVRSCEGVAIVAWAPETSVCKGETARILTTVKNTGGNTDTFKITSTLGTPSEASFVLEPQGTKGVYVDIPTGELEYGLINFSVKVESEKVFDLTSGNLYVNNCYGAMLKVEPSEVKEICPCETVKYKLILSNTGQKQDTYKVTASMGTLSEEDVVLGSNENKTIELTATPSCDVSGEKDIDIVVKSSFTNQSEKLKLNIKKPESCYAFTMEPAQRVIKGDAGKGYLYTINVENKGVIPLKYTVSLDGPEWIYSNPKDFELKPSEKTEVYVYASAPYGTADGIYTTKVKIETDAGLTKEDSLILAIGNVNITGLGAPTVETPSTGSVIVGANETTKNVSAGVEAKKGFTLSKRLIIAVIVGFVILLLIVFGPDFFGGEEETKEDKPKRGRGRPPKEKKEESSKKDEIEEILDNI